jgi:hypothetical protein
MNLYEDKQPPTGRNAGAVPVWGPAHAAPAHPMTVGAVGFGPAWTMEDSMAASIVRLECENEELRATVATWEVERGILIRELERLREMVANERAKDAACAEKCRDKYEADRIGGHDWSNR